MIDINRRLSSQPSLNTPIREDGDNDRERRIFEARRLADDSITLRELADEFGVSRERVRQCG